MERGDPFDADDGPGFRPPPPPDDRLWRHPSEMALAARTASAPTVARSGWPSAVAAGSIGAVATVAALALAGVIGEEPRVREVVVREAVTPAVATVGVSAPDIATLVGAVAPAIVRLEVSGAEQGVGSGVLIRDDGHLLTNAHVVEEAERVSAVLADGRTVRARVVGLDRATDIALVKLESGGPFATAVLGATDSLSVGEPAIAIGSPLGLRGGSSVTVGVVSALGREIESPDGPVLHDMIQTDAAIANGSSGGALLDRRGAVVGITTAFAVTDLGNGGLGFATPIEVARAVADDLLLLGRVRTVWFGVKGSADTDAGGIAVAEVVADGPAAAAGLRAGDVLTRVDGRLVTTMSELRVGLRRRHPGDEIAVVYLRDGARRTATVVLAERRS